MNDEYLISVIITAYNESKRIIDTFESLNRQTFQDFEIVIVNDGSTDNTENIILKYKDKHQNINYIYQENAGQGVARNKAIDVAKGKYIFILDADDTIEAHTFELCVNKMNEDNYDCVSFEWKREYSDKVVYNYKNKLIAGKTILSGDECYAILNEPGYYTWNKMYNKDFLNEHQIKFGEGYVFEDHIFHIKTALSANKIGIISSPFYNYKIHSASTIRDVDRERIRVIGSNRANVDKLNLNIKSTEALSYIVNHAVNHLYWLYNSTKKQENKNLLLSGFLETFQEVYLPEERFLSDKTQLLFIENDFSTLNEKDLARLLHNLRWNLANIKNKIQQIINKYSRNIYQKIGKIIPVQENTVLLIGQDYKYSGNLKYLYRDLIKEDNDKITYFYVTKKYNPELNKKDFIKFKSFKYYYYLYFSRLIIFESYFYTRLPKRSNQTVVLLWHATTVKKLLFDSPETYSFYRSSNHKKQKFDFVFKLDYFITDVPSINKNFQTAFLLNENQVKATGYPRMKYILENQKNNELITQIKDNLGINNGKPTILYAPTWRDYNYIEDNLNFEYLLDLEKLLKLSHGKYNIVFKDHPYLTGLIDSGASIIDAKDIDTQDLLLVIDYLISDYSSIVFDAVSLNKPIFIYAKDFEVYTRIRGVYEDVYERLLNWEVKSEEELIKRIETFNYDARYLALQKDYCSTLENYKTMDFLLELLEK